MPAFAHTCIKGVCRFADTSLSIHQCSVFPLNFDIQTVLIEQVDRTYMHVHIVYKTFFSTAWRKRSGKKP